MNDQQFEKVDAFMEYVADDLHKIEKSLAKLVELKERELSGPKKEDL